MDESDIRAIDSAWSRVTGDRRGSAAAEDETLLRFIRREASCADGYASLAARSRRRAAMFAGMAAQHREHARELSAAYFIMTGKRPRAASAAACMRPGLMSARERYLTERALERDYLEAAGRTDGQPAEIYGRCAASARRRAEKLMELIGRAMG